MNKNLDLPFPEREHHRICEMCFVLASWTVIDAGVPPTERNLVSLARLKAGK